MRDLSCKGTEGVSSSDLKFIFSVVISLSKLFKTAVDIIT